MCVCVCVCVCVCDVEGGESIVSSSMLSVSQSVNLLSVEFLCRLCQQTDDSLHTDCVVADLVKLTDCDNKDAWSPTKAFNVHLVSKFIGMRFASVYCSSNI